MRACRVTARSRLQVPIRIEDRQPRPHGALGVVFVRGRIAEIGQHAIAQILRDHAAERLISLAQQVWKAPTTSRCSSGSSRVESALEPTMSQNMMVSWRRSAEGDGAMRGQRIDADMGGAVVADPETRLAPHLEQNLAFVELPCRPQVTAEAAALRTAHKNCCPPAHSRCRSGTARRALPRQFFASLTQASQ